MAGGTPGHVVWAVQHEEISWLSSMRLPQVSYETFSQRLAMCIGGGSMSEV